LSRCPAEGQPGGVPARRENTVSFVVGLTGGIGSGKSTVADLLPERGAALVDTDAIAHQLSGPHGEAMAAITASFGDAVRRADGGLDRAAMRRLVFADAAAKRGSRRSCIR
jgi:dephospho-CoA kinase